jgi:hypothetical protein
MNIEHWDCLSLFLRRCEGRKPGRETLQNLGMPQSDAACGKPAMAFHLPLNGRAI